MPSPLPLPPWPGHSGAPVRRFPKTACGAQAPQTNPAHWEDGGRIYANGIRRRRLYGELVRVEARRDGAALPGAGVVVRLAETPRGRPWYQVFVGGAVHELWAEELEDA